MRYIQLRKHIQLTACIAVAVAVGAAVAPASYAYVASPEVDGSLLAASFPAPTFTSASVSPLLAREMAVLTDRGISLSRARQAVYVQNMAAQTNVVGNAEAAMAGAFGGVWFDSAAAQLHIGVISPASRLTAERVAAQAGLIGDVIATPVRSTWDQLLAAQSRWDRKLANLFARGEVQTGIDPERSAVIVTLSSSVPRSGRATIAREASKASVTILVKVAPSSQFNNAPAAETKCNKFAANKAYCEPSITSGVTLEKPVKITAKDKGNSHKNTTLDNFKAETVEKIEIFDTVEGPGIPANTEVWGKPNGTSVTISKAATAAEENVEFTFRAKSICSAGPQAIPLANKKQRDLLTAGHCMRREAEPWSAYNTKAERGIIGPTQEFSFGVKVPEEKATYCNGKCDGGDYGAILIEAAPGGVWQTGKANIPVFAVTAQWGKGTEKSYPVKGSRKPMAGAMNCREGQTSGEACGEITKEVNKTVTFGIAPEPVVVVKGLVEDGGKKMIAEGGDSGGPFMFIEENNEVLMEGTVTGTLFPPKLGNPVWFYPLEKTLERLKMELLTTGNEVIGKEGPFFKVEGKRLEAGGDEVTSKVKPATSFVVAGGGIELVCKKEALQKGSTINGSKGANSATSTETIEFSECTVKGNGTPCEVEGAKFTTTPLTNTLAYDEKERTGHIDVLFSPVKGVQFATVKFVGAGCKFKETVAEGSVAADALIEGAEAKLGAGKEVKVGELKFPAKENEIFVESEGKEEAKKPSLKVFGVATTFQGTSEVEVGGKKWTVATE